MIALHGWMLCEYGWMLCEYAARLWLGPVWIGHLVLHIILVAVLRGGSTRQPWHDGQWQRVV